VNRLKSPLLQLRDATVIKPNGKAVLQHITLTIEYGEHTAILGPNGSGKSSLIQLITRHHYPQPHPDETPPMLIAGRARWNIVELRSLMGIVSPEIHQTFTPDNPSRALNGWTVVLSGFFASASIFPHHSVTDEMRASARRALEWVDGLHLANQPITQMSAGEARRMVIARALAHDPPALLLDEPTTGLDIRAAHHFSQMLAMIAQRGKTIMLVTHHIQEILPEIQRVILLKDGHIFRDGSKETILTSSNLTELYGIPLQVSCNAHGYYAVQLTGE
jgi:iron complex transport system ATP-binding protein